jgi:hypothetical protein
MEVVLNSRKKGAPSFCIKDFASVLSKVCVYWHTYSGAKKVFSQPPIVQDRQNEKKITRKSHL